MPAAPRNRNMTMFAGDTVVISCTVVDSTGTAVNITGLDIEYELGLSTPVVKTVGSGITITSGSTGVFTVTLDEADTSSETAQTVTHQAAITDGTGDTRTIFSGDVQIYTAINTKPVT